MAAGQTYKYVIAGAGLAGASAVEGIRTRDKDGAILVAGAEPDPPYHRPPLSKDLWLKENASVDDIFVRAQDRYAADGVDLRTGSEVTGLDPGKHTVHLGGEACTYEKLLLATGGAPRTLPVPGGDLDEITYMRTLGDFRRLREVDWSGEPVIVVGGGFIGSEMAAALVTQGAQVTLIFPEAWLCARVFPESLGRAMLEVYRDRGATVLAEDAPERFAQRDGGIVMHTKAGREVTARAAVAGIGIEPATSLAEGAGLSVDNGIVVDANLCASHPDVYAAGDVARFPYTALGKPMRMEHWDNARAMGRHAGANMAGDGSAYTYMPYFFSDLFEVGYEAVGDVDVRLTTTADWKDENRKGVVYYLDDGRVRGAMMCGVWDKVDTARELIRRGKKTSPEGLKGAI